MKSLKMFCMSAVAMAVVTSGAQAGPLADATADALWGIEIGGYVDVAYGYNFNTPRNIPGGNAVNVGRVFDVDDDEFNFHLFQLYLDRLPEAVGEAGFRVDFGIGEDANLFAFDEFDNNDEFALYQAYISYVAPIGNGLTIDLGRFVTWYGYEVIESPANDNYSRSFLYGFAIPFTHTGLRLTYPINDQFEISGGVTNGWDQVEDNNDSPSWHLALRWLPTDTLYVQNAFSYGPELTGNNRDYTFLYDLVASYTALENITLGVNFDWADQDGGAFGDGNWWGLAGYVRFDVNEQMYVAGRIEYMEDDDGLRFGNLGLELWEVTATLGYQVTDGLETRLEFRHDDANSGTFFLDDGGTDDTQNTLALEVIYSF